MNMLDIIQNWYCKLTFFNHAFCLYSLFDVIIESSLTLKSSSVSASRDSSSGLFAKNGTFTISL